MGEPNANLFDSRSKEEAASYAEERTRRKSVARVTFGPTEPSDHLHPLEKLNRMVGDFTGELCARSLQGFHCTAHNASTLSWLGIDPSLAHDNVNTRSLTLNYKFININDN